MRSSISRFVMLLSICCVCSAKATTIETFDNGSNNGDWRLTTNPDRLLQIEPNGGNPGAFLHGQVASSVPTWYVPAGTQTDFLGDYFEKGVVGMGIDLNIFVGNNEPSRTLTLDLRTTQGTGDFFTNGIEAYYIGPDISNNTPGWVSFDFSLDARSQFIPAGWTVYRAPGVPGTFLDWQTLMHNVETVGFELGQPGFAYTNHTVWDLGLDNARLITAPVPEPSSLVYIAIAMFAAAYNAIRAKCNQFKLPHGRQPIKFAKEKEGPWAFSSADNDAPGRRDGPAHPSHIRDPSFCGTDRTSPTG